MVEHLHAAVDVGGGVEVGQVVDSFFGELDGLARELHVFDDADGAVQDGGVEPDADLRARE